MCCAELLVRAADIICAASTIALAMRQFTEAENMTNELAALDTLVATECPERQEAIDAFEAKWSGDELVLRSWFSVQALCPLEVRMRRGGARLHQQLLTVAYVRACVHGCDCGCVSPPHHRAP